MTNDNALAQTRNAAHSIALAELAGEFVVSCFPIVDGEPDTSTEVFFRVFSDGDVARRVYTAQARLLACSASDFDRVIEWVYHCVSSLQSCLHREVPNEARILAHAVAELRLAALKRGNAGREARKLLALTRAAEVLASRTEGLAAKVAEEASARALRGQP